MAIIPCDQFPKCAATDSTPPLFPLRSICRTLKQCNFCTEAGNDIPNWPVAYALLPAWLPGRWRTVPALFAGALYGLLNYGVNLYGFTLLFPWFELAHGWVTLVAHLVFGIALAGCYLLFSVCWRTEPKDIDRHARQHNDEES